MVNKDDYLKQEKIRKESAQEIGTRICLNKTEKLRRITITIRATT